MIYILNIPCEASEAVELIKEVFEDRLVGIYLYGSFVLGGLKPESDLDLLVITIFQYILKIFSLQYNNRSTKCK